MKSYWKLNSFMKRINSFFVYLLCSILSIFIPITIDKILYRVLKEQFENGPKEN